MAEIINYPLPDRKRSKIALDMLLLLPIEENRRPPHERHPRLERYLGVKAREHAANSQEFLDGQESLYQILRREVFRTTLEGADYRMHVLLGFDLLRHYISLPERYSSVFPRFIEEVVRGVERQRANNPQAVYNSTSRVVFPLALGLFQRVASPNLGLDGVTTKTAVRGFLDQYLSLYLGKPYCSTWEDIYKNALAEDSSGPLEGLNDLCKKLKPEDVFII